MGAFRRAGVHRTRGPSTFSAPTGHGPRVLRRHATRNRCELRPRQATDDTDDHGYPPLLPDGPPDAPPVGSLSRRPAGEAKTHRVPADAPTPLLVFIRVIRGFSRCLDQDSRCSARHRLAGEAASAPRRHGPRVLRRLAARDGCELRPRQATDDTDEHGFPPLLPDGPPDASRVGSLSRSSAENGKGSPGRLPTLRLSVFIRVHPCHPWLFSLPRPYTDRLSP